jgi:signal transduction histidine kinase
MWLVIGNVSQWHVWGSSILLHAVIWLCVPVYLHFHWVFPKSLGKVPKLLLGGVYLVGSGLAAAELFQILPGTAFYLGFLIAVMGSAGLLIAHFIVQPMYRKEVRGIGNSGGALLALPLLPLAYYYAIYRRQLGGLEARSNQLIASYLFFILLGTVLIIFVPLANTWFQSPDAPIVIGILVALTVGVLTATGYPHFTSWIEKRVLSMPMSLTHMAETYSERISTNLKKSRLIQLLKQELLPSLLIRQSALLRLEDGIRLKQIYTDNVNDHQLPTETNIHILETEEGNYYASTSQVEKDETLSWIKLAIPLKVGNELIGLWLLGSRDPDDYYAPTEIPGLQSVANQTAIALVNIEQAERIHALYQADIERTEEQRANIARDLHDIVLNELASLSMKIDDQIVPGFQQQYQIMITRTREMISGLRPAMLSYGLPAALEELVDETSARVGSNPIVQIDISPSDNRYDLMVETHLYRIIQQAVDNALQHAQASAIQIYGSCELDRICLTVKDDGIGFMNPDQLSFDNLLKEKHFGLAGMYERAEIIGAELAFDSAPDRGTRVRINWTSDVLGQTV